MVLLKDLDEDSAFKNAYREDWPESKYLEVGVINELRLIRADQAAMHANEKMEPMLIKSPAQTRAEEFDNERRLAIRAGIMAQLQGLPRPVA